MRVARQLRHFTIKAALLRRTGFPLTVPCSASAWVGTSRGPRDCAPTIPSPGGRGKGEGEAGDFTQVRHSIHCMTPTRRTERGRRALFRTVPFFSAFLLTALTISACGVINLGKWKGIEKTAADENYYLVKKIFLTAGSASQPRYLFDHAMQESVNLVFQPASEKNVYTAHTIWFDPAGQEYRTIRQTYEKRLEEREGAERPKEGATRVHSMATNELFQHKPGLWKVELYLDDKLVRRFNFEVR